MSKYFKCIAIGLVISTNPAFGQEISRKEYIEKYSSLAVKQMHQYKIPASITLAQGILESNNGNSRLATKANNHFGIKCHGWEGKKIFADDDKKNECFRNYKNVLESFVDHSLFLNKYSRYEFLFDYKITDYKSWAKGLKKAGYATNNKYPELLIKIIEENKLYQFDSKKIDKNLISGKRNIYMHPNKIKYVISKNQETYKTIAKSLNIKLKQILKYNDDNNQSVLNVGTKVFIQPKRNRSKQRIHVVNNGEDLRTISQTYGVKMKSLKKRNQLILKNSLNNGDKLRLR
ncbi:MAG: glucosaminidase domain-containing protein [Flavobacteriales bacterium]|nr:glucosaminidase domain-containing protein [Flavobacteriales bacterium]MBL6869838.1 glucosaminidase domain-containing protein [Flavobacteriales bacterium]